MANEIAGWKKEVEHFKMDGKVDTWIKKADKLSIIDVPSMNFDEVTKASLMEVSLGGSI